MSYLFGLLVLLLLPFSIITLSISIISCVDLANDLDRGLDTLPILRERTDGVLKSLLRVLYLYSVCVKLLHSYES